MKFSEVTVSDVAEYIREDETEKLLPAVLAGARAFVLNHTHLTEEMADQEADLTIALLAVCADIWDRRGAALPEELWENPVVAQILGSHGRGLVGGVSLDETGSS